MASIFRPSASLALLRPKVSEQTHLSCKFGNFRVLFFSFQEIEKSRREIRIVGVIQDRLFDFVRLMVSRFGIWKVTCTNLSTKERFEFQKKSLRKERLNVRLSGLKASKAQGSIEGISVVEEKEINNKTGN